MFGFGGKQKQGLNFTTDLHCHILPGIDDGSPSMDDSLAMAEHMARAGIEEIYATPHIKSDIFPNDYNIISGVAADFSDRLTRHNIGIKINFAAEYFIDMFFIEKLEAGERLLTLKDNYILVESSMRREPMFLYDVLFRLQSKGYKPVMAHPERYIYYGKDPGPFRKMKKSGCLLQLNLFSLSGYYGKEAKAIAEMLLKNGLVDLVGSDAHRIDHAQKMSDGAVAKNISKFAPENDRMFSTRK
ncbi:MAG: hypothetical protein LIO77_02305 [Rikenellaceae bacterium]|nr:hypothetical protein [Rikenellaceae bacterium]